MGQDEGKNARTTTWHTVGDASDEHERCRYMSPDNVACHMPALWLIQRYSSDVPGYMILCDSHKRAMEDLTMLPGSSLHGLTAAEAQRFVCRYEEETGQTVDDYGEFRRRRQLPLRFQTTNGVPPDRTAWQTTLVTTNKRAAVWDRTGGRCWYCGEQTNPWRDFTIDHVVPQSRGGSDDVSNLVPSCRTCNLRKKTKNLEEFRTYLQNKDIPDFTRAQLAYLRDIGMPLPDERPPMPAHRFWFEAQGLTITPAPTSHVPPDATGRWP